MLPAILWTMVITMLSTSPGIQLPEVKLFELDKFAHFVVYAILTALLIYGFRIRWQKPLPLLACTISSAYGMLMEWVQWRFFPGRYFEWADEFANFLGSACVVVIFYLFFANQKK